MVRWLDAQRGGIFVHELNKSLGQRVNRFAIFLGTFDNLIFDVGHVANISHLETRCLKPTLHHVENHQHAGVAEVAVVVNRHAANVHANFAGDERNKVLFLAC